MRELKAPGYILRTLEWRALGELATALLTKPLMRRAPKGDGHPVVVFPGFGAGDLTTAVLREFLDNLGYTTYGWDQGVNRGPREGVLEGCLAKVREVYALHGGRKVTVIGWSLGGIYARHVSHELTDMVRQVVTMGTPFAESAKATTAWRLYELSSGQSVPEGAEFEAFKRTPPVPTTSIFSRTDGVVAWQCCIEKETKRSENIEVYSSHCGLGVNLMAMYIVADRLAQPEGKWKRFDRSDRFGITARLFPDPHRQLPLLTRWLANA
jgi:pimeloyl-ACP methyl ester carboxylesterase